ncbi:hypothetical protein SpCBS45565_g00083 [Spizellomyces sp. 'palustris']|nr:hypothetical protein SpCBS45565_g00083 [Spizellomyces sp. 'palustris']
MSKRSITHCIFDMDGLLLDTESIYTKVTQTILDKYAPGKIFTWDSAKIVVQVYDLPMSVEEYLLETSEILDKMWPECALLPGVERLVRHLHLHKIPIAVATSSTRQKYLLKTQNHRHLFDLFASVTCGDDPDILRGKPAPDLFLAAQKALNAPIADACLVFEDAVNGVEAGNAAGMHTVWVPDEQMVNVVGREIGATLVLNTLEDFEPELFGLPSF